jgi:hypothetical protein
MLFTSTMPTHAEKNRGRRVLCFPLKRANTAVFCLWPVCKRDHPPLAVRMLVEVSSWVVLLSVTCRPSFSTSVDANAIATD